MSHTRLGHLRINIIVTREVYNDLPWFSISVCKIEEPKLTDHSLATSISELGKGGDFDDVTYSDFGGIVSRSIFRREVIASIVYQRLCLRPISSIYLFVYRFADLLVNKFDTSITG